jgi:hypothetical protein
LRKILGLNSPGTATTLGGDDYDMINQYLTGVDQSATDPVTIATITRFWDNRLKFYNPARTKSISIRTLPFLNDYDLTIPLLSSNDEIVGLISAQQLQNKTININENLLKHGSTNMVGDLLVGNGVKYDRLQMSSNAGYHLAVKTDLSGLEWVAPVIGAGETNTAANLGTAGVGVYHSKSGVQFRFKKINSATNGRITITDDTTNNEIDLGITPGTDGQFLKTVGTTPTWSTLTSAFGTVLPDGSNFSGTKYGLFTGGARDGDRLLSGLTTYGDIDTTVQPTWTYTRFTSEEEDDAICGFSSELITSRQHNPEVRLSFKHDLASQKGWAGLLSTKEYPVGGGGDNPVEDNSGVMIGYHETDTNWLIQWNNGGAVPVTFNTGLAKGGGNKKWRIILNNSTASITVKTGEIGAETTYVNASTSQVPAQTTGLALHLMGASLTGTAMSVSVDFAQITEQP